MKTATIKQLFLYGLLTIGLTLGTASCVVVHDHHRDHPAPKKKSHPHHPHGGPPGQTKKAPGHPGKKHH